MKILFFVPIIHAPEDMGTIMTKMSKTSEGLMGKTRWDEHKNTVSHFWDSISHFFEDLKTGNLKIYQDGMVAEGKEGLNIIKEGVGQGSVNYRIISSLIEKGAILIKTEDIALVKKEYDYIRKLTLAKSPRESETAALRYRLAQRKLLEDRDTFIVQRIESTLKENETGVLFLGAYHEILSKLTADMHVVQVKDQSRVKEYHNLLTKPRGKANSSYQQLSDYLASPVSDITIE